MNVKMKECSLLKQTQNLRTSMAHSSDTNEKYEIWNSVLHVNIAVSNEKLETG